MDFHQEDELADGTIEICSICQEDIEDGDSLDACSNCKNLFHPGCIEPWLEEGHRKNKYVALLRQLGLEGLMGQQDLHNYCICPLCRKPWLAIEGYRYKQGDTRKQRDEEFQEKKEKQNKEKEIIRERREAKYKKWHAIEQKRQDKRLKEQKEEKEIIRKFKKTKGQQAIYKTRHADLEQERHLDRICHPVVILSSFFVVFCLIAFALAGPSQFSGPLRSAYSSQRAENHVNKIELSHKVKGYQISMQSSLIDLCNPKKKAFCVLLFLPPLGTCNASCRLIWLKKMVEAQMTEGGDGVGWGWAELGTQTQLENALDITNMKKVYLAVVQWRRGTFWITQHKKNDFSSIKKIMRKSFTGTQTGRQSIKGQGLPSVATCMIWDGETEDSDLGR